MIVLEDMAPEGAEATEGEATPEGEAAPAEGGEEAAAE